MSADVLFSAGETPLPMVCPFIAGRALPSVSHATFTKYAPSTGLKFLEIPEGDVGDVNRAVSEARESFSDGRWADRSVTERKAILFRLADLVVRHTDELARFESLDVGKPISDARSIDLPLTASVLRYAAEGADKLFGSTMPGDGSSLGLTLRSPRGVIGAIVGWNFPLVLAAMKIGPALATGNSIVLKPSELSSLSSLRLASLALEAGVPAGVLNVVPGLGSTVGDALARHPDVDMLSFTGSSAVGKRLLIAAGESNMKRLLLECGGKSSNIVFDDCPDLDGVADAVTFRMFWNQGQVCTAGTRLIVQSSIKDALVERVRARAAALTQGDPLDPATTSGPLISRAQMERVLNYVRAGLAEGARPILGGATEPAATGGYYVAPTIFDAVRPDMRIAQEEIFGPVLSVLTFDSVDDACRLANASNYGLSATIWTQDINRAHKTLRTVRAGEIDVKATARPSAGVAFGAMPLEPHRQSGLGMESGMEGLQSYTVLRSVRLYLA